MAAGVYSEDQLVEQPAIALLEELGWETLNAYEEEFGESGTLGRDNRGEVVLANRLMQAMRRLNPDVPYPALQMAEQEITRDRSAMSMVAANREIYALLKDGFVARVSGSEGETRDFRVRYIDWSKEKNNDFLLVSQLWVTGEVYTRRTDLTGFVNGIPLLFVELKASHRELKHAYSGNLTDYKDTIPHLFWCNALVILSNGHESKLGSVTSAWEHFSEWKKINDEDETGMVSLETMLRGTCEPARLLDIVENFILFSDAQGGTIKLVARYHQYLGVNRAVHAVEGRRKNRGKLGVFWHTQGSGKSYSMVFFSRKVLRRLEGNWTFVVVTDRMELDEQIYKNFASSGAITESEARAESGEELKRLLAEDHRYVFTLIQKFHTARGETYPQLSARDDVIVMTDEAHRSQYDTFALNMRNALPNAAFIGFTGTPLLAGEEKTREVFGDYVSVYNFRQAIEDKATLPLYYENRIPGLQLVNEEINDDLARILEEAELHPDQEERIKQEFARDYYLITDNERLEQLAADVVEHFMSRSFAGKAMYVAVDKKTAVKMYDKVQANWQLKLEQLKKELLVYKLSGSDWEDLQQRYDFMKEIDMAVVVSQSQNELKEFKKEGLDILTHRKRMRDEQLDVRFKNPDDPLRLVFVCGMWMTGFDAPTCSTIYLDKPMKNHTLMQTIARANRVFPDKNNGLIVDYYGVFRNLEKALGLYGSGIGESGGEETGEPVALKQKLIEALKATVESARTQCNAMRVDIDAIQAAPTSGFAKLGLLQDAVEKLLADASALEQLRASVAHVNRLYKAILPDAAANQFAADRTLLLVLMESVRRLTGAGDGDDSDLDDVRDQVRRLVDDSIVTEGYMIPTVAEKVDLSKMPFDTLEQLISQDKKRTEAERLKRLLERKLNEMVKVNRTRLDLLEKFKALIDEYNLGSQSVEAFFRNLTEFAKALSKEEQRSIQENLSEEELAIFDLLTKPRMELTAQEIKQVKQAAKDLLQTLRREKLVLDWRKQQETRAGVRVAIEEVLDRDLPESFNPVLFQHKCLAVYEYVYDMYAGAGRA
ncbi:MAG TPA: type I restriction endonuclease subunit R [Mariprofundaceae bacterium]|nr:type I restriction endonuclease subunit R [Mariprofundaceae bacterium]